MLPTIDTDFSISIQDLKKRFEEIQIDLRYLAYSAQTLMEAINESLVKIESLSDEVKDSEIIL